MTISFSDYLKDLQHLVKSLDDPAVWIDLDRKILSVNGQLLQLNPANKIIDQERRLWKLYLPALILRSPHKMNKDDIDRTKLVEDRLDQLDQLNQLNVSIKTPIKPKIKIKPRPKANANAVPVPASLDEETLRRLRLAQQGKSYNAGGLNVADIKDILNKLHIPFQGKTRRADLLKLLEHINTATSTTPATATATSDNRIQLKHGNSWIQIEPMAPEIRMSPETFEEIWNLHPEQRSKVRIGGQIVEVPRYQESFGQDYYYSGMLHRAHPITHPYLKKLLQWVRQHSGQPYSQILINWYQGGDQYIGEHADDTTQLVPNSSIYSFSFGQERDFVVKSKKGLQPLERYVFPLPNNTMAIMGGEMQKYYKHSVPKRKRATGRRINITFRLFKKSAVPQPAPKIYGLMLDLARHYLPVSLIITIMNIISSLGYNTVHLHLSDDQAFLLETETLQGRTAGPAEWPRYSIKDQELIADTAQKLGLQIIPEIDIPGHSLALQEALQVPGVKHTIKLGTITHKYLPDTYIPQVLALYQELVKRFRAPYIHMGGDETSNYHNFPKLIKTISQWTTSQGLPKFLAWDDVIKYLDITDIPDNLLIQRWRSQRSWMSKNAQEKIVQVPYIMSWGYYLDHADDPITVFRRYPLRFNGDLQGFITCMWGELVNQNNIMDTIFPTAYLLPIRWQQYPNLKANQLTKSLLRKIQLGKTMLDAMRHYGYPQRGGWKKRRWAPFILKGPIDDPRSTSSVTTLDPLNRPQDLYPVYSKDLITITAHLERKLINDQWTVPESTKDLLRQFGLEAFQVDLSYLTDFPSGWKNKIKDILKEASVDSADLTYQNGLVPLLKYILTIA